MELLPESVDTLRNYLPAEMRILRGVVGLLAGVILTFGVFIQLLSGNWQLGFTNDWILTSIFLLFVPAIIGISSPLWYWFLRPLWYRLDGPAEQFIGAIREVRFFHGLTGSILGLALLFPVSATSEFWIQSLFPFGLLVGIIAPLWFWILRPILGHRIFASLQASTRGLMLDSNLRRMIGAVGGLFLLAVMVTTIISIPVVGLGDSVSQGGLAIRVSEMQTTSSITSADGEQLDTPNGWGLVMVHLEVENTGSTSMPAPGTSVGDIAMISEVCDAQTFGEPSNNCNQVNLDGNFSIDGRTYSSYELINNRAGGTVAQGERLHGWLVYRIESRSRNGFEGMVIVDDVGRWAVGM